jgi:hypothetical protein
MIRILVAAIGAALAASALADPIAPAAVRVVDGDTIEARGSVFRLVGFNTQKTGRRAQAQRLGGLEIEDGSRKTARTSLWRRAPE